MRKSRSGVPVALTLAGTLFAGTLALAGTASADPAGPREQTASHHTPRAQQERLTRDWVLLWNGDYRLADRLISPDLRVHAALLGGGDGSAITGPAGLVGMITQIRASFTDLRFTVQVGPIIDGDHVVVRWTATGTYSGGFPGATAPVGTHITFDGTDLLRVERGQIAEYWLNADTLGLVTQLAVSGS